MREKYEELLVGKEYEKIFSEGDSDLASLYKCKAFLKLNDKASALPIIERLYANNDTSVEYIQIYADTLNKLDRRDDAQQLLKEYVWKYGNDESILRALIESLLITNRFDDLKLFNDARSVYSDGESQSFCLAIQCFNKPDLLAKTLESLLNCEGKESCSVVLLQDSYMNAPYQKDYRSGYEETNQVIREYLPKMLQVFNGVTYIKNTTNLGTAPSCRKLLDYCFKNYHSVMFIEDDFILSPDSILLAKYFSANVVGKNDILFASCESVFFDSKGKEVPPIDSEIEVLRSSEDIVSSYILVSFVPSTCFITNRDVWDSCGSLRGALRGPETLNAWLKFSGKSTALPVLPRGCDVGMFNENGYSVALLGKENVKENKTTYLVSDRKNLPDQMFQYSGDKNLLYSALVLLNQQHLKQVLTSLNEKIRD